MRKIGLMGGSYNPIHKGHVGLAKTIRQKLVLDEVWLMLSPMNPLKRNDTELIEDVQRLTMARLALEGEPGIVVSDAEMTLPRPNYTVRTLAYLKERNPDCVFSIIIGSDNLAVFDHWKDADEIMRKYEVIVYPRPGYDIKPLREKYPKVNYVEDVSEYPISSTEIRRRIRAGEEVSEWLDASVYNYICRKKLYGMR